MILNSKMISHLIQANREHLKISDLSTCIHTCILKDQIPDYPDRFTSRIIKNSILKEEGMSTKLSWNVILKVMTQLRMLLWFFSDYALILT